MRVNGFVLRLVVLACVWLLATATLTLAAGRRAGTSSAPAATSPAAPAAPQVLVVPNVVGQAYVFAKGMLEDGGFAWRVGSGALGYPGNKVVSQVPAAGTRVVDTGAPTVSLRLVRSGAQTGLPDARSPYPGTPLRLADLAAARPVAKPKVRRTVSNAPAVKPKPKPKPKPNAKPKPGAIRARPAKPMRRKPDFAVPGARPEPQNEISLSARARALDAWLARKPRPTDANVGRWLYQHAWIVTGARYGWWHGREALQILIAADRRVHATWGIGRRSERIARAALAEVEARAR